MALHDSWQSIMKSGFGDVPKAEDRRLHFGDALMEKWVEEFENRCWGSPQFAEISFHTLFGQLPAVRNLRISYENNYSDLRVHTMLFQRSGTGKGRGFNFTMEMSKKMGLISTKPDAMTDAVLLGSFERVEHEEELLHLHGLLDPERDPPINLIIQNEATLMLDAKRSDWSKDFMTYYQVAMNPIGTPDNLLEKTNLSMRGEMVAIQPVISFFLTTYPPDKLLETITKAGFIQRMITLYNIHEYEERVMSWKTMASKTGTVHEGENYIGEIINALHYINKWYTKYPSINVSADARGQFLRVMETIYRPLNKVNQTMREHLADFVPRTYENVIKLAYHHAIMRLSPLVENVDVLYALNTIRPAWTRMISYMEESDEMIGRELRKWSNLRDKAYSVYDMIVNEQRKRDMENNGWIKRETLVKFLSSNIYGWDKSKPTTRSRLDKMINTLKYFEEKKEVNIKYVRKRT